MEKMIVAVFEGQPFEDAAVSLFTVAPALADALSAKQFQTTSPPSTLARSVAGACDAGTSAAVSASFARECGSDGHATRVSTAGRDVTPEQPFVMLGDVVTVASECGGIIDATFVTSLASEDVKLCPGAAGPAGDSVMSFTASSSGRLRVRTSCAASGRVSIFGYDLLVGCKCPVPEVSLGSRGLPAGLPGAMLSSDMLEVLPIEWRNFAAGTITAWVQKGDGSRRAIPLPCAGSVLGAGIHNVVVDVSRAGCIPAASSFTVQVDASCASPRVEVAHTLAADRIVRVAVVSGGGDEVCCTGYSRVQLFVDGAAPGLKVALLDKSSSRVLMTLTEDNGGWCDASAVLEAACDADGRCEFFATSSAPGFKSATTGPFRLRAGRCCPAPVVLDGGIVATLPDVFVLSGERVAVEARDPVILRTADKSMMLLPSAAGVVEIPVAADLAGPVTLVSRRIGCEDSAAVSLSFFVDAQMEPPSVLISGVEGDRRAQSGVVALALPSEALLVGRPRHVGGWVTYAVDGGEEVRLGELPAQLCIPDGARSISLVAHAGGMAPSTPVTLRVGERIMTPPALVSHASVAGTLYVNSHEALQFTGPMSGLPGAALHVLSSALPAPLVLPADQHGAPLVVAVGMLGTGKPGEDITITVCETAPGAFPGRELCLRVTVDCVLPGASVDASSGISCGDGLTLLEHVCFTLTSVASPPDATLHVTLRDGDGGVAAAERIPVGSRTEVWHYLPPNERVARVELHVAATGCAPSPVTTLRVSVMSAPEYVVRDAQVAGAGKAELLRRAGFTTIWLLRLVDDEAAKEAGFALGDMVRLRGTVKRLNNGAIRVPRLPPPLSTDSSTDARRTAASALRGVDDAVVDKVAAFLEAQALVTPDVVAEFVAGAHAANDLVKGGIPRGLAVGLVQALRHPEVTAPPIPEEGGSLGYYRTPASAGMRVTGMHPGHGDRVQHAKWTTSTSGLETTVDVVLRVSGTVEEHAHLVEAHAALQDTGAVARCLGSFNPAPHLGETRYCAVLERLPQTCEDCVCHPEFRTVPAPQRDMYALAIADALAKIHEAGWVHNDVKEANVMFTWAGGAWRAVFIDLDQATRVHAPLPPPGRMVVTRECAAPEYLRRWRGDPVEKGAATTAEASADTFCYGLIFARLHGSGERVFPDPDTAVEVLLTGDGEIPAGRLAGLSSPKREIVLSLCSPVPSARPRMRDVHTRLLASRGMSVVASVVTELGRVRLAAEGARDGVGAMLDVRGVALLTRLM